MEKYQEHRLRKSRVRRQCDRQFAITIRPVIYWAKDRDLRSGRSPSRLFILFRVDGYFCFFAFLCCDNSAVFVDVIRYNIPFDPVFV